MKEINHLRDQIYRMLSLYSILYITFAFFLISNYYMRTTPTVVKIPDPKFSLLAPYNITKIDVQDNYTQLIDMNNFVFINNPQPCQNYSAGLLLVVIVSSNPAHVENRKLIRSTWGRNFDSTKVVFLIGESKNAKVSNQVRKEIKQHGDIVQGNFIDTYRNLTYKHVMGLKWVTHHCSVAKYVLKTDDDVAVHSRELRHFLAKELSPWGARDLIMCQVIKNAPAFRSGSKWTVTKEEYAQEFYPTYCAGWTILYSQDVVNRLLEVAQSLHYFWVDDVQITGVCAEKIGVPRTVMSTLMLTHARLELVKQLGANYTERFIFGPPNLNTKVIKQYWKAIPQ